jgi:hypothetical protein
VAVGQEDNDVLGLGGGVNGAHHLYDLGMLIE